MRKRLFEQTGRNKFRLLNERLLDPTHDEMVDYLMRRFGDEFKYDIEPAIYYFAADYHGGQSSNLYSALSTSVYRPGPNSTMDSEGESVRMMYDALVDHFGN